MTAALLGALVVSAAAPSSANAACNRGEFCLWEDAKRGGALYHSAGNDRNLHNDVFARGVIVGDNVTAVKNNGLAFPGALVDVVVYEHVGFRGARLCVPLGAEVSNLKRRRLRSDTDVCDGRGSDEPDRTWNDGISSYRWVASC